MDYGAVQITVFRVVPSICGLVYLSAGFLRCCDFHSAEQIIMSYSHNYVEEKQVL